VERESPAASSLEDLVLGLLIKVLRLNYPGTLNPRLVTFRHSQHDCETRYRAYFQAPVRFDCPTASLALPLETVDNLLPAGNPALAMMHDELISNYLVSLESARLISRVKKIITEHLPTGDATLETVAEELFVSPRTLQRMLRGEDTTFLAQLAETRRELADRYLADTSHDLSEIAYLLGFSGLSSFSRSFKRWTGKPPAEFRKYRVG
jgi:AraC-like DNA-binding protein